MGRPLEVGATRIIRTSVMYGRLGRIYATYSKLGCSLRNCNQRPSQNQLTVTGNRDPGVDRPAPNGPSLSQSQLSAEASFSVPFHQGARIRERVRGRECVAHRRQVVVEGRRLEIPLRFPFGIIGRFHQLSGGKGHVECLGRYSRCPLHFDV
jgi:hypothetical protein